MKPMEDCPLFLPLALGVQRDLDVASVWTESEVELSAVPTAIEVTVALRDLRKSPPAPPPPSTLAIRIAELRGRVAPLRLAELRDDRADEPSPPAITSPWPSPWRAVAA